VPEGHPIPCAKCFRGQSIPPGKMVKVYRQISDIYGAIFKELPRPSEKVIRQIPIPSGTSENYFVGGLPITSDLF
jgi:hypothetical protein